MNNRERDSGRVAPQARACRAGLTSATATATATALALAAWLSAAGICLAAPPWRKDPQPRIVPPQLPEATAPGTVAVDLTQSLETNGFKPTVTTDQRIRVHLDLGRVLESQGLFEAALSEYQQGLAACDRRGLNRTRSSDEALAHRRIGNALDRLGRFAQAEMHYRQAVKLSPRDAKNWNDAGYSYYLQRRWSEAERTFRTALRLAPDDVRIKTNLGLTLAASGRTQEALPILSEYSGDAIGHANLGYLLAATGQSELARQQYHQALALRPTLDVARRALAQLDRAGGANSVAAAAPPPQGAPPLPANGARTAAATASRAAQPARDARVVQTAAPANTRSAPPRFPSPAAAGPPRSGR